MPFDATPLHCPEVYVLDEMARLLATPERWCKGKLRDGAAMCLVGALRAATGIGDEEPIYDFNRSTLAGDVFDALSAVCDGGVEPFNDSEETTHDDVLDRIRAARATFVKETVDANP